MHNCNRRERDVGGIEATVKLWLGQAPSSTPPATQGLGAWGEFAKARPSYARRAAKTVIEITGWVFGLSKRWANCGD